MSNNGWKYPVFEYEDYTDPEDFTYDEFEYDDYKESYDVKSARAALKTHIANKPVEYTSKWQTQLDDLMKSIMNRDDFSYDLNGDALYQQYKDKYIQQGKLAMGDAIGQASAMTGGYGNSYAQSVGQQAYQGQLDNLNDIVPQLYQMALDKYNMEGQELYNQYGMVADRDNTDYGRYRDTVSDWYTNRDYLAGRYDSERDYDYSKYVDGRDFAYGKYSDDRTLDYTKWADDRTLDYNKYVADRNLAYDEYATDKTLSYEEYRAAIADDQWQKQFDADQDYIEWQKSQASSGGGGGNGGGDGNGSGAGYDNGGLTDSQIKEMQNYLGIDADGKWGPGSTKAAGNLSAREAWKAYQTGNLETFGTTVPKETKATTTFINTCYLKSEYLARGNTARQYNDYIEGKLASAIKNGTLSEGEALYLIQYYGLS